MIALVLDRPRVFASSAVSSGRSAAAEYVSGKAREVCRRLKETYSIGLLREDAYPSVYDELKNVFAECAERGWDGYDAQPISREAIDNTRLFLDALPLGVAAPSVGAEPDGSLTLEWYSSPKRLLSISIGPENLIYYACILGLKKFHGSQPFFGIVPKALIDLLNQVG